ncbi:MAG TPA: protein-L-isoaspartate(D-aspartate) O-methyltransferase, partial [Terriglobales bacterium]|nr:protein-L-isoaspartate(D-aspartate) O-methyltransferase [Terriglobales bacterium]
MSDFSDARLSMVATQLRRRGLQDERVLSAMEKVPRHLFIPEQLRRLAYDDEALPVGNAQTISQPFIVGYMLEQLDIAAEHRVLEIGTGTGYQAAILAELAREVFTIERLLDLYEIARNTLSELGYTNIDVIFGDGTTGLPDRAPFDRIIVAAAAPQMPPALFEQLAEGGRMVLPVGAPDMQ